MEKFSLKWDDFSTNVTKSFQSLRYENDFFDITLIGDDYKHVTAHKLVLSSCSEYFKNVFSNNKKYFESKAMICLEGLIHSDLNNVLDFIYEGQVQIYQHDLDRFLRIAERLKLEGLMKQHEDDKTEDTLEEEIPTLQKDLFVSKSENQMTRDDGIIKIEKPVIQSLQSMEELDQMVEDSFTKLPDGFFCCRHCNKMSKNKGHMREHVEVHFEGLSFPCTFCDATLRSRNSLRFHKRKQHSNLYITGPAQL